MQEIELTGKALLAKELELAFDPYNGRKEEVVAALPKEMSYNQDGKITTIKRELLLTEGIESTGLIQSAVAQTVIQGAEIAKCWMNILPVYRLKGNAYVMTYGEAGGYAEEVAEAAEFPNKFQKYTPVTFTTKKYGYSPKVSREMVEDGVVDVIAQEIQFAGMNVMNKVEQLINDKMLEGSGTEFDTAGTNQGVKAVISAAAKIRALGFNPKAIVQCPAFEAAAMNDLAPSYYFGGQAVASNGLMPSGYLGLSWYVCNAADVTGGSYTWAYATNDDIGAMVVDPARAGGIAISRPLTVEQFKDPIHDLDAMIVSIRMDAQVFLSTAICRIKY